MSVDSMDLKNLKYRDAIARSGSFLRAAALVNVTQPALSKAILQLEKECATKLLQRGRKGVSAVPTSAGELVLKSGRIMLAERERLMSELRSMPMVQDNWDRADRQP